MKLRHALAMGFLLASLVGGIPIVAQDLQDPCITYTPECAKQQQERIRKAASAVDTGGDASPTATNPKPAQPNTAPKLSPEDVKEIAKLAAEPAKANAHQTKAERKQAKLAKNVANIKAEFPGITDAQALTVATHGIFIGMTVSMLDRSFHFWSGAYKPTRINNTYTSLGVEQQCVYESANSTWYLYFRNGFLTSFQINDK